MQNHKKKENEIIETLVRQEEEAAFHVLPERELSSRLEARLKTELKKKPRIPFWLRKPVPTLAGVLVIICGGVIALLSLFSQSPQPLGTNAIEQFLQDSPGMQTLAYAKMDRKENSKERTKIYGLQRELAVVFSAIRKEGASGKSKNTFSIGSEKTPSLDYKQKIEILIKEETIHRFFLEYFRKYKEEENG